MQWKVKRQKGFIILLVVAFLLATLGPVYAQSVDDLQQEQKEAEKQIDAAKEEIEEIKGREDTVYTEIQQLSAQVDKLNAEIRKLDLEITRLEGEIANTEEELAEAEEKLDQRSEILSERVRNIHKNGNVGYIEVLFEAKSFSDFINRLEFLRKTAERDSELVQEVKAEREDITERKSELEQKRTQTRLLKERNEANQIELEQQKGLHQAKLEELKSDRKVIEAEQKQLEEDSKEIERLIKEKTVSRGGGNPETQGGIYAWPTPGYTRISSGYGNRIHPISGRNQFHSGIDLPAARETDAVASENGVVIYAAWRGGYGNTVILDHGGGVTTLYAHLNSFSVSVGQTVTKGQRIAGVGTTGASTGNHVHYEVRINGAHTNPMSYLR